MSKNTETWLPTTLQFMVFIGLTLTQVGLALTQAAAIVANDFLIFNNNADDKKVENENVVPVETIVPPGPASKTVEPNIYQNFPRFSCLIEDVKGKKSFVCGVYQFKILTYDDWGAVTFLGGSVPEGKSLESIGCQLSKSKDDEIICREERKIEHGRATGSTAYRSFTAIYKLTPEFREVTELVDSSTKIVISAMLDYDEFKTFATCVCSDESFESLDKYYDISDVVKCNVGKERQVKKCLMENPYRPGWEYVTWKTASQCWLDAHVE